MIYTYTILYKTKKGIRKSIKVHFDDENECRKQMYEHLTRLKNIKYTIIGYSLTSMRLLTNQLLF